MYKGKNFIINVIEYMDDFIELIMNELNIILRTRTNLDTKSEGISYQNNSNELTTLLEQYECKTLTELSIKRHLNPATVRTRIKLGWTYTKALGL